MQSKLTDEQFWERYEANDEKALEEFLETVEGELQDTINYLILHRQLIKEDELEKLQAESEELLAKLRQTDQRKLLAELKCFRDVLALQKRLVQENGAPRA